MGITQLLLWIAVAAAAEQFDPGGDFGRRPLLLVVGLLSANFLLYLASLALVWKAPERPATASRQWRAVLLFAVLFRVALLWSQPVQELDLYRYLWDGRVLAAGINPYRYSPAQVEAAREAGVANVELKRLNQLLQRSPEVAKIFSHIDHRSVPTIYPPLSESVFAATALVTPERASVRVQVGVLTAFVRSKITRSIICYDVIAPPMQSEPRRSWARETNTQRHRGFCPSLPYRRS